MKHFVVAGTGMHQAWWDVQAGELGGDPMISRHARQLETVVGHLHTGEMRVGWLDKATAVLALVGACDWRLGSSSLPTLVPPDHTAKHRGSLGAGEACRRWRRPALEKSLVLGDQRTVAFKHFQSLVNVRSEDTHHLI